MQPSASQNPTPSKKGLKLPSLGLPKPVKIALGVLLGFIIIVTLASVLFGSKNTGTSYTSVLSRSQEIVRVSALVQAEAQDSTTTGLAATVQSTLLSQQTQLVSYLKTSGTKIDLTKETLYLNKNTDAQMQAASQNGSLPTTYDSYLKTSLGLYQSELQTAYQTAGTNGKTILSGAYNSTAVIIKGL